MNTKKSLVVLFSIMFLLTASEIAPTFAPNSASATSFGNFGCPFNTEVGQRDATLVGEVLDDGGDPDLEVWFEYGRTSSFEFETSHKFVFGPGPFCADVFNLDPCTTYHYRAIAANSAFVSEGDHKTFTTFCPAPVHVDLRINNSDGPITKNVGDTIILSWDSENADFCEASGDWSGSKSLSGSQTVFLSNFNRTHNFEITCGNFSSSDEDHDSVQVHVNAIRPPTVITRPAIITL